MLVISFFLQVISNGTQATSGAPFQGYNGIHHRLHSAGGGGGGPYGGGGNGGYGPPPPSQHNNPSPGTPPHLLPPPTTQNGGGLPHPVIEAVNNPLIHPAWQVEWIIDAKLYLMFPRFSQ